MDRPGRHCKPAGSAQAGFSLLEIFVALFLLVIIVVAVTRTSSNARRVQHTGYFREQAASAAQSKMDQLAAASLLSVAAGRDSVNIPLGLPSGFIRTWTVTDFLWGKQVQVVVEWTVGGEKQSIKMATVVK